MISCPECGKPLVKETKRHKYCCMNDDCPVVFVLRPHKPSRMRVALTPLARH